MIRLTLENCRSVKLKKDKQMTIDPTQHTKTKSCKLSGRFLFSEIYDPKTKHIKLNLTPKR